MRPSLMKEADVQGITIDGLGGAEDQDLPGGGIDGIRRRLVPFDGTLELVSPVGGATFATIRVPRPVN